MTWDPDNWEGECMGEACSGGRDCPCWIDGAEEGAYNSTDEEVTEVLATARCEIERVVNELLRPLEDRLILKGDKSVQGEVNRLEALKRRLLEVVG